MPHDPVRVEDTLGWLRRAGRDLRAAAHGLEAVPPLRDVVVFHCQQAAEKALKSMLVWFDVPFRKTHNLEELGAACIALDASLEALVARAVPLTEYAWRFRYPGELLEPSEAETIEALRTARAVYDAIVQRLPDDVRPALGQP
jgi:HEPN domain-containing protein